MKRLLIFSPGGFTYGAQRGLLNLIEAACRDFRLIIVLSRKGSLYEEIKRLYPSMDLRIFPQPELILSFSLFYYFVFPALFLANIIYLIFIVRKEKIDLLCSNSLTLVVPAIFSRFAGIKHIWYLREFFSLRVVNYILGEMVKIFSNVAICQSKEIAKQLFLCSSGAQVIHEPLNPDNYKIYNYQLAKKELGIPERAAVISIVSRIHPSKGQYEFLKKFSETLKKSPDLALVIAGDITKLNLRNLFYKYRIYRLIRRYRLANIIILGFRKDIDKVFSASDICVFPFRRNEPYGIAVSEALMFKKPAFYPKEGGLREIYEIFEEGNVVDFQAIERELSRVGRAGERSRGLLIPDELSFRKYNERISNLLAAL